MVELTPKKPSPNARRPLWGMASTAIFFRSFHEEPRMVAASRSARSSAVVERLRRCGRAIAPPPPPPTPPLLCARRAHNWRRCDFDNHLQKKWGLCALFLPLRNDSIASKVDFIKKRGRYREHTFSFFPARRCLAPGVGLDAAVATRSLNCAQSNDYNR